MAKGTRKVTKRINKITTTSKIIQPFSTRNLHSALMNIHKNMAVANRIITKKLTTIPVQENMGPRTAKTKYLNTMKAKRNLQEQIKKKREQLKHNIDDITMMMSRF